MAWIRGHPFVLMAILSIASCSAGYTPRQSAEGYLAALASLDFEGAARYVTDDEKVNFEILRRLYSKLGPEEQKKFQVADWVVTAESVTGDHASVDFTFDGVKKGQLLLKKSGDVWKVDQRRTF